MSDDFAKGFSAGQQALKDTGKLVVLDSPELAELRNLIEQLERERDVWREKHAYSVKCEQSARAETAAAYERSAELSDRIAKGKLASEVKRNGNPVSRISPEMHQRAVETVGIYVSKQIRALATQEQSAALDVVKAEKLKEDAKGIAEPCPCTLIEQDESCPVGYPSLLCSICQGTGNTTPDKITALACEMLKIASDLGEAEDPFAAWEVIVSLQEEAKLCEAVKAEARAQGMREAAELVIPLTPSITQEQLIGRGALRKAILAAIQKGEPK